MEITQGMEKAVRVDSIHLLIVKLNAIKRTELLTECNRYIKIVTLFQGLEKENKKNIKVEG